MPVAIAAIQLPRPRNSSQLGEKKGGRERDVRSIVDYEQRKTATLS